MERRAGELPESAWERLARPPRYQVQTQERQKPENVKERIVVERGYKNLVLQCEDVAEFKCRPGHCNRDYRIVALRKLISVEKGQERLFEQYRYFFYITNERDLPVEGRDDGVFVDGGGPTAPVAVQRLGLCPTRK